MKITTTVIAVALASMVSIAAVGPLSGEHTVERFKEEHTIAFNNAFDAVEQRKINAKKTWRAEEYARLQRELKARDAAARQCVFAFGGLLTRKDADQTCALPVREFYQTVETILSE